LTAGPGIWVHTTRRKPVVAGRGQSLRVQKLALQAAPSADVAFDDRLGAVVEDLSRRSSEVALRRFRCSMNAPRGETESPALTRRRGIFA
jgi:hypothetical protein